MTVSYTLKFIIAALIFATVALFLRSARADKLYVEKTPYLLMCSGTGQGPVDCPREWWKPYKTDKDFYCHFDDKRKWCKR